MNKKKKFLIGTAVLLVVLVVAAVTAVAAGTYGSKTDPLVTLSYVESVKTSINSKLTTSINTAKTDLNASFNTALSNYKTQVNNSIKSSANDAEDSVFVLVELSAGKTLNLGSGVEFLLRSGTGKISLKSGAVVMNTTAGTACENGETVTANNMYVTASTGVSITADTAVTLLIRGQYTAASSADLSDSPEDTPLPSAEPSEDPSPDPSEVPSEDPTPAPSDEPSDIPSDEPQQETAAE